MNETQKENLKRWIDALRSGEYPQIKHRLFEPEEYYSDKDIIPTGYCCLGVASKLANSCKVFSVGERDYYGITGEIMDKLVNMNDDQNKNFNEIADYLETLLGETV